MPRALLCWAFIAVLGGCRHGNQDWMPLDAGLQWNYAVRSGFQTTVAMVAVERKLSVAGVSGWLLSGPTGESRLAWKRDRLLAEELSGTRFQPPIALLGPVKEPQAWKGKIIHMGESRTGVATTSIVRVETTLHGRKVPALKASLKVAAGRRGFQITTWFVEGVGITAQEQLDNGRFVRALDIISGP